jgi:hypothetical protein
MKKYFFGWAVFGCVLSTLFMASFVMTVGTASKVIGAWGYNCTGITIDACTDVIVDGCTFLAVTYPCKLNGRALKSCVYTGGYCHFCTDSVNICEGNCLDTVTGRVYEVSYCSKTTSFSGCR